MTTVGFIGLGAMGAPMARRALKAGYRLKVWNRTPARSAPLVEAGAEEAASPTELAASCDIVLSCLLNTEVIRKMYSGEEGLLAAAAEGTILIEHGTFDPEAAEELAAEAETHGVHFVDAPISGGAVAAESGSLVVMAGGPSEAESALREVAATYASTVEWLGSAGSGLRLKLINQMLVSTHVAVAAEAAQLIQALGIDHAAATRALSNGWAQSTMLERCLPIAFTEDLSQDSNAPIGGLKEAQRLLIRSSDATGVKLDVFRQAAAQFTEARDRGWSPRDLAALATLSDQWARGTQ
ncbi:NAD(P)-dependent oxidoreductase [Nesterenkonia sp. MY13]|uniref:NAD(P)-dependent oxidoreductase n=1 Tax=Nesterenkonia sedimenti TaxID=1463632 RepID=A0A7X8TI91_9MICC|nr:NAD(P)-dependent oxidoreductase [Nesterenkonia sedimenti]NLS09245.1 NAD(P)-dependent oxidoreductase [Nesterenkonia sedimenti]